jgi:hypothetical protein
LRKKLGLIIYLCVLFLGLNIAWVNGGQNIPFDYFIYLCVRVILPVRLSGNDDHQWLALGNNIELPPFTAQYQAS